MVQKSHHIHHVGLWPQGRGNLKFRKRLNQLQWQNHLNQRWICKRQIGPPVQFSLATKKVLLAYNPKRRDAYDDDNPNIYFVNEVGKRVNPRSYRQIIDLHAKSQGIKRAYPHLFRPTCITRMCLYTDNIFQVQMLAGHKDLATTRRYHHVVLSYDHIKQNYSKTSQLLDKIKLPRYRANKYNLWIISWNHFTYLN